MSWTVTAWKNDTAAMNLSIATSLAAHDIGIALMVADATSITFTTIPTGWTQQQQQSNTADGQTITWFKKDDCTGSEGTLTWSAAIPFIGAVIGCAGGNNANPLDVAATTPANNNTAQASPWSLTGNAITPVTNGALLVAMAGDDITLNTTTAVAHVFSDTGGASWTTNVEINDNVTGSTDWRKGGIGTATQASAAATTVSYTGTLASRSAGRSLFVIALRPAGGGGGGLVVNPLTGFGGAAAHPLAA